MQVQFLINALNEKFYRLNLINCSENIKKLSKAETAEILIRKIEKSWYFDNFKNPPEVHKTVVDFMGTFEKFIADIMGYSVEDERSWEFIEVKSNEFQSQYEELANNKNLMEYTSTIVQLESLFYNLRLLNLVIRVQTKKCKVIFQIDLNLFALNN